MLSLPMLAQPLETRVRRCLRRSSQRLFGVTTRNFGTSFSNSGGTSRVSISRSAELDPCSRQERLAGLGTHYLSMAISSTATGGWERNTGIPSLRAVKVQALTQLRIAGGQRNFRYNGLSTFPGL